MNHQVTVLFVYADHDADHVHWPCELHQPLTESCSKLAMQVDTIFMLALTIYITQLLFFTWALQDQQTHKWPLVGYAMLPVIMLQHGDATW